MFNQSTANDGSGMPKEPTGRGPSGQSWNNLNNRLYMYNLKNKINTHEFT